MKIAETHCKLPDAGKKLFEVTDIQAKDISEPSKNFLNLVRQLKGVSSLNTFTVGAFTDQVLKRFAENTEKKA